MIDIKIIRENKQGVIEKLDSRNMDSSKLINEIFDIDIKKREVVKINDDLKFEQNKINKDIPKYKKEGKDTEILMKNMKTLSSTIKENSQKISILEEKQKKLSLMVPNIPDNNIPIGMDEKSNIEIRRYMDPTKFDFDPKAHWDLGKDLNIIDSEVAGKVTGSRFTFYRGLGARLERAIINFYLDTHTSKGYEEILPPFMVNRDSMIGTGQLPKFEDDAFKIENTDYFLIPTAEVPLTNMHREEILILENSPIKYCAYSPCFRAEAGSAGRDTRGLIRQHQFNKVELVKFCLPEDSENELEMLLNDAEDVLKALKLPYRVVNLSTGDIGFSSLKTYDIEVFMPSYKAYKEISSCSNFGDFQARRANIRYKKDIKDKSKFVHTLNGSGVAIGRTVAAILENFQNIDGSVNIPEVLIPYMGNIKKIS